MKKEIVRKEITRINPVPDQGLTAEQVSERISAGYANLPVDSSSKSVGAIIAENVFTYFNLIFTILAVLLIAVGQWKDLSFMPIIIFNALIGIIQELKSKATLDKLNVLNAPTAKVIRGGKEEVIPSDQLVLDDIIVFKAGDQIPADAVVVEGKVSANEALLTGEADEITKDVGSELMSGSFIVSGSCRARLTAVGADSYISRLTLQAKQQKSGEQSEMIRSLNKIVKFAGIIIIPIGGLQFFQSYAINGLSYQDSILAAVASVIGMIVGTLVMTVFGSLFNAVYLLPKFSQLYGIPMDVLVGMGTKVNGAINSVSTLVLFAVVPFNLLKGVVVSILTFLLYKRLEPVLFRHGSSGKAGADA